MRVAFTAGNSRECNTLYGGCILGSTPEARKYAMRSSTRDNSWCDDFHIYTLRWSNGTNISRISKKILDFETFLIAENILLSVDGHVYGSVVPPLGGFGTEKDRLKLDNIDSWRGGSTIAPFDKEVGLSGLYHSFKM